MTFSLSSLNVVLYFKFVPHSELTLKSYFNILACFGIFLLQMSILGVQKKNSIHHYISCEAHLNILAHLDIFPSSKVIYKA